MKITWPIKLLGDVCDITMGQSPDGESYNTIGAGVPLINGPVEFSEGSFGKTIRSKFTTQPTKFCKKGDLILCVRGSTTGRMNIAGFDACVGRGVAAIRAKQYQPWVNHFISSKREEIHDKGTGATFPNVSGTTLAGLRLPMPPPAEQQRIVGILDKAFEGIATAKANAEKNLQNARALFESYLQFVFSQHGEGWVEKTFSDICEISSVLVDPRQDEYLNLPHVGGANIVSKTGELIELKTAREEGLISGKFVFDQTMVLYSKIRPYLMKVARPEFRGLCSADIYPLSAKVGELSRDYLFHLLLSPEFTEYANAGSARAGMPKVNRDHLFAFRVHLPSLAKQKKFAAKLDALHEETQHLESVYQRKLDALDELKKSLLHQAFSGQL
jgi:type I restriction enzyme, S subunit